MKYQNIREEELKNKLAQDYFWLYDCSKIIGNLDFCVAMHQNENALFEQESLLWAEAKKGSSDIYKSLVQLILTIGKARTFDKFLPPAMLGAFDGEKIAFVPYNDMHEVFYINDFNWNVTPSNHDTKEFKLIHEKVKTIIDQKALLFNFLKDDKELQKFIKKNFVAGKFGWTKTKIDKNNFMVIYNKWLQTVKPTIEVNWEAAQKSGIIDGDFYLADLLSSNNETLKQKLFVLLKITHYELDRKINEFGLFTSSSAGFIDNQVAYNQFWNKYERPPKEEYWDYIVERRDLLVPQDVRERKGSFFTPQIWVELSQKYLTEVLGEDWQDEDYVWDCAAGTGNLLAGLTNKYNIYASTLDKQDVEVMHDRIKNGANLLDKHVFQFDFLNDDFTPKSKGGKLPDSLYNIINDPEKRKKLVVYINPPYAEADNRKGEGRSDVAISMIHKKYANKMGYTKRELYIQFLTRVYCEIYGCMLADFSTLKNLQAPRFLDFRKFFRPKLEKIFVVPAASFDNVSGDFPIGFKIWNTKVDEKFKYISVEVFNESGKFVGLKNIWSYDDVLFINDWVKSFRYKKSSSIATIIGVGSDFQNQRLVRFGEPHMKVPASNHNWQISKDNLIESAIYYAVRHSVEATWLNDREQFLYPNDGWKTDKEFQNDCLAFTLFSNNIQSKFGINHWIPFTEQEVDAREKFESHFMTDFIKGKQKPEIQLDLFTSINSPSLTNSTNSPSLTNSINSPSLTNSINSPSLTNSINSPSLTNSINSPSLTNSINSPSLTNSINSPSLRGQGGVDKPSLSWQGEVHYADITPNYLISQNIPTKDLIFSDKFFPYNPKLKKNSRLLRKAYNLSEVLLWKELSAGKWNGYTFYRQKPILNYIADFYCKELHLVIEIDGSSHDNEAAQAYDAERDRQMKALGLTILRIKDRNIKQDMPNVLRTLEGVLTPPCPLKEGELTERLKEGELTERLKEGELTERLKEGELTERLKEGELTERLKEGELTERLKEGELTERLKEGELTERLKEGELVELVKEGELTERLKEGELTERLKEGELTERLKEGELTERLKEGELVELVKEGELTERLKEGELVELVKEGELTERLKEGELVELVKEGELTERLKEGELQFSPEATAVFDAGRALWKYYHQQPNALVNASLYDIRAHFQGRNETGKMNNKSPDETYMRLIGTLRESLKQLAAKIEPKVYAYGFLKEG